MSTSTRFDRFGVAFWSGRPWRETIELSRQADRLGFDSFWLAEYYHYRSIGPLAALIGEATSRIKIGLGVLPTHTRHPGLIAMEAATLDEISNGRLLLGLGAARTTAIRHRHTAGPIAVMRETIEVLRQLLNGQRVTYTGRAWELEATALAIASRGTMPIYVGTYPYSAQMLRLTGAIGDGALLVWCNPQLVRSACESIAEGAQKAGRSAASVDVAAYIVMSVDEDAGRARDACRPLIASYAPRQHRWVEAGLVDAADLEPVIAAANGRGGAAAAIAAVSDALVDKVAIAGTPAYCRDRLAEYAGTGLTTPVAYEVIGPDAPRSLELLAKTFIS